MAPTIQGCIGQARTQSDIQDEATTQCSMDTWKALRHLELCAKPANAGGALKDNIDPDKTETPWGDKIVAWDMLRQKKTLKATPFFPFEIPKERHSNHWRMKSTACFRFNPPGYSS